MASSHLVTMAERAAEHELPQLLLGIGPDLDPAFDKAISEALVDAMFIGIVIGATECAAQGLERGVDLTLEFVDADS